LNQTKPLHTHAQTGFGGYWLKDYERTTPDPQPIDVMLGASKMAMKAHETIPGIWVGGMRVGLWGGGGGVVRMGL